MRRKSVRQRRLLLPELLPRQWSGLQPLAGCLHKRLLRDVRRRRAEPLPNRGRSRPGPELLYCPGHNASGRLLRGLRWRRGRSLLRAPRHRRISHPDLPRERTHLRRDGLPVVLRRMRQDRGPMLCGRRLQRRRMLLWRHLRRLWGDLQRWLRRNDGMDVYSRSLRELWQSGPGLLRKQEPILRSQHGLPIRPLRGVRTARAGLLLACQRQGSL